jgi:putative Holliday junction resolvase
VTVPKRLLGVDHGQVRIGLAVSDPDGKIASPLATYQRQRRDQDAAYFQALVKDEEIGQIILGLPIHADGREGCKATEVRAFGSWLEEIIGLPVIYWDERFTTVEAEAHLWSAGLTHKARKARRDRVSAQIILRSYLDTSQKEELRDGRK